MAVPYDPVDSTEQSNHAETHRTRYHLFFSRIPTIDWTEKKPTLQEFRQAVKDAGIDWVPRSLKSEYPMPEEPKDENEPTVPRPPDEDENESEEVESTDEDQDQDQGDSDES